MAEWKQKIDPSNPRILSHVTHSDTPRDTAQALLDWQALSYRYGFDGWLLWLRGSEEHTALWNGPSDGGVINDALAPANRPDPCER